MRPSQKPNRTRGRGSRRPSGNNVNRVFESNGPEGKVRGTPQQIIEKYLSLARDSQTSDNRVVAENFFQHAEHYQRLLAESMNARQEQRRDNPQPDQDRQSDVDGDSARSETPNASASPPVKADDQQHKRPGRNTRRPPRESEVSGLTTIDSGPVNDNNLLVDSGEMSASQPRRRQRGNGSGENQVQDESQGQGQKPAEAPAEAESQPE